jgi:hypothetical protein
MLALPQGFTDLRGAWAGLAKLGNQGFNVAAFPERAFANPMLLGMAFPAQTHGAKIVRLLRHSRAATQPDVGDFDRSATAASAAFMRPHEIAVGLRPPPTSALGWFRDATGQH